MCWFVVYLGYVSNIVPVSLLDMRDTLRAQNLQSLEVQATLRYVCTAHVWPWGRQWGMCTQGHLLPVCSCLYDHDGSHSASPMRSMGLCVHCMSNTYFNLKDKGYKHSQMKMFMASTIMDMQYVLTNIG